MIAGSEQRERRLLWGLLFATHLAAVLWSRGYHHADEHFQVLEFARWKLGLVATWKMPWELGERMRPWLHALIFLPLEWLSQHLLPLSPFTRTTLHRACVAALALFTIRRLTRGGDRRLLWLYATLFFFPFLDVRISSEVIGGWLIALAYALDTEPELAEPRARRALGIGLLLGLAGVIRLQLWSMVFGLLLFHLLQRRPARALWQAAGIALAIALGMLADRWGYGEFTCVPCNYVHQNLVLDKASHWGVAPAYAYVPMLLEATLYLPGAVLIAALAWQWLRRPIGKLTCITLPFVLLHLAIGHKELRFLFSLAPFMPLVLLSAYRDLGRAAVVRWAGYAFLGVNLALLVPFSVRDATPLIGLYAALRDARVDPRERLYYTGERSPLRPDWLYMSYYLEAREQRTRRVKRVHPPPAGLFATLRLGEYVVVRKRGRCQLQASRYPDAVVDGLRTYFPRRSVNQLEMWSLWRCP